MRSALLLAGDPRFCREFDSQLENLKNSDIDWIVVFWKEYSNTRTDSRSHWIPNGFKKDPLDRNYIISKLPSNHRLVHYELIDSNMMPPIPEYYKDILKVNLYHYMAQLWILNQCDLRRQLYDNYDLVIRSRPDLGFKNAIDLEKIHAVLTASSQQKIIYVPKNYRSPNNWTTPAINDMFAVGLPDVMKIYCNLYNLVTLDILKEIVHNETVTSKVLTKHGIIWPMTDLEVSLRTDGTGSQHIDFVPNFGRWE